MKIHRMVTIWPNERRGASLHGGFCKGCYLLCKEVEKTGSIHAASSKLGMAYSKAWRLMLDVENDFGVKIFYRDGARGSTLTKAGEVLMHLYEEEVRKCSSL